MEIRLIFHKLLFFQQRLLVYLDKIKDDAIEKTSTTIGAGGKLVNNQVKDFTESSTEKISVIDSIESKLEISSLMAF